MNTREEKLKCKSRDHFRITNEIKLKKRGRFHQHFYEEILYTQVPIA